MTPGWYAQPNDAWIETVALLQANGEPWSEAFQISDLRWLAGQVRIGKSKRIPGYRKLAARWGVSDWDAREIMRDEAKWKVNSAQLPRTPRATSAHSPDIEAPLSKESRAVAAQLPRNIRDTRDSIRTKNQEEEPLLLSSQATTGQPSTGSKKPARQIPTDLADAYAEYRKASGITRNAKLNPHKGMGQKLWGIHSEIGADAVGLFQWLATSQQQKAIFYREGKYTAETVKRHLEALLDLVDAKPSGTPHSHQGARANGTHDSPGHVFFRAYQNARGRHPDWLDHVPSDERGRFERASMACQGLVMIREMSDHPLEKPRAIATFNQAFERTT